MCPTGLPLKSHTAFTMNGKQIVLIAVAISCSFSAGAQNVTASPYSMFGLGEIEMGDYGTNAGMGGIGIGHIRRNSINTANPASLTALDPQTFVLEGAATARYNIYRSGNNESSAMSGNLQRIALGTRFSPKWVFGAGMVPFTRVGYFMTGNDYVEGGNTRVNTSFKGSGGLTRIYISNAYQLTPRISIGLNTSLIYGSLNQTEKESVWTIEKTSNANKIYFDGGIQYSDTLSKKITFTVGLTGGYQTGLTMHNSLYAYDSDGYVVADKSLIATERYIPEFYGIGFSLRHKNGLTAGVDYRFQRWSRLKTGSSTLYFRDLNRVSAGISYIPNGINPSNYFEAVEYQAGFSVSNSYIDLNGNKSMNYSVTAGGRFPLTGGSSINVGLEYGKTGMAKPGSIQNEYLRLTVGFSFEDIWFVRAKFD